MSLKISIITVSYNSANTIEDTILSVVKQDYPDIEYIIIDGGSTDGTLDIIEKYRPRLSRFISEPDNGIYDAINKGLRLATGEVVGFLHADDFFYSASVITRIASEFQADRTLQSLYSDLVFVDRENPEKIVRYWKSSPYKNRDFERAWHPPHPTFYVRLENYEKFGNFDTTHRIIADGELMFKFLYAGGISTKYLPGITVCMRRGGTSNEKIFTTLTVNYSLYKLLRKHKLNIGLIYFFHRYWKRIIQLIERPVIDGKKARAVSLWFKS